MEIPIGIKEIALVLEGFPIFFVGFILRTPDSVHCTYVALQMEFDIVYHPVFG